MKQLITYVLLKSTERNTTRGALLIEALIALSLLSGLLLVGSQSILAGLYGAKHAGEKDHATAILRETVEAIRASTNEEWQNLYGLLRSPIHYHPIQSGGKWAFFAGDETIVVNGLTYTRYFTIEHVSRNDITRTVESIYSPLRDDPGTQKVTVAVVWGNGSRISQVEYLTRWRNKVCVQTEWNSSTSVGVKTCPDASFFSSSDITVGAQLELTPIP